MQGNSGFVVTSPNEPKRIWLPWLGVTVVIVAGIGLAWFFLGSNNQPKTSDVPQKPTPVVQPPTATFKDIEGASTGVTGSIEVGVALSDTANVVKVEYYIDDEFVGVTYALPFDFVIDTTTLTAGTHTITAKVYTQDGQVVETETTIVVAEQSAATEDTDTSTGSSSGSASGSSDSGGSSGGGSGGGGGGGSPPPEPDTTAPSTPANIMTSADDGYTVDVTWDASTDNVGVTEYQVFRDGSQIGTADAASYADQTVVPGNSYEYYVVAVDAAANVSGASTEPSITLAPTSIWIDGDTPQTFDSDATAIEVGVKFRPLVDGQITGIKFYKGTLNTGTHVGNLWTSGGSNLATATFSGESASGWQQVAFSTPLDVTAGTTYVASYFAPNGRISYTSSYFATRGITSQYLRALASGVEGNNGVFRMGSAGFPSTSFANSNYWVDVTFAPNPLAGGPTAKAEDNSQVYSGYPGSDNTGVPVGKRLPVRDRAVDARQPGATIENIEVNGDSINVFADNTTIRNARVTSSSTLIWGIRQDTGITGLTVEDSEVYGDGINQIQYGIIDAGSDLTVERVNIHTVSDGIQANLNVSISDSFVHDILEFAGDHNDSFLSTGGDNIVLTHNTFHNPIAQTSALGLFCDFSAITNVTATNNLLMGGGYAVYAGGVGAGCAGSHDIKFINNRFSRELFPNGGFNGPVTNYNAGLSGNQWTGNVWHDDNTVVTP